jgi:hypothetical protein
MTYATFTDDCLVALGMVHDDRLWYRDNMLMNVLHQEALLVTQNIARDYGPGGSPLSSAHKRSTSIVPVTYNQTPDDSEWSYLYFDLPTEVYDIPHDSGLVVRYHRPSLPVNCKPSVAGATFTPAALEQLSGIWGHRRLYPREDRPYTVRTRSGNADRVRLYGVSPLITKLLVAVFAAPRFDTLNYDEEMRIEPHRLADLKRLVLNMSVWPMGIPQERDKNEGRDMEPNQVVNTRPLISVNDPLMNSAVQ